MFSIQVLQLILDFSKNFYKHFVIEYFFLCWPFFIFDKVTKTAFLFANL